MKAVREESLKLRLKGYSYNEINRLLGVPKSTLSGWFSGVALSDSAQQRIKGRVAEGVLNGLVKRNRMQTHKAWQEARNIQQRAAQRIGNISKRDLVIAGVAIYWAEGYKRLKVKNGRERTSHVISLTNADPEMIGIFVLFLIEILKIPEDKIYLQMRLYEHINEEEALRYWSKATGLPKENFKKTTYLISKSSFGKRPYNRLPYGTVAVAVNNTKKFHELIGLINGIRKYSLPR